MFSWSVHCKALTIHRHWALIIKYCPVCRNVWLPILLWNREKLWLMLKEMCWEDCVSLLLDKYDKYFLIYLSINSINCTYFYYLYHRKLKVHLSCLTLNFYTSYSFLLFYVLHFCYIQQEKFQTFHSDIILYLSPTLNQRLWNTVAAFPPCSLVRPCQELPRTWTPTHSECPWESLQASLLSISQLWFLYGYVLSMA